MSRSQTWRVASVFSTLAVLWAIYPLCLRLREMLHTPLMYDDAYMFVRYALHVRHGLGMSWNLDGVHTYGPTSLLWSFVVFWVSFLPGAVWAKLIGATFLCGLGAAVAMSWAVSVNARSEFFRSPWRVLPAALIVLTQMDAYRESCPSGMETALSMLLCAVFVGASLRWSKGETRSEVVALIGLLLYLSRPESGVVTVLLPGLLYLTGGKERPALSDLGKLFAIFLSGVALQLLCCRLYFGTALPLSFYMKSRHGYEGYTGALHSGIWLVLFFKDCRLLIAALIVLARRVDRRLMICCVVPLVVICAYFGTVLQIMGFYSRYYAPYIPLLLIPAFLVLDGWIVSRGTASETTYDFKGLPLRAVAAAAVVCIAFPMIPPSMFERLARLQKSSHYAYVAPAFVTRESSTLPELSWREAMEHITDDLVRYMPDGSTIAASEVGYLGTSRPWMNVIDLAGLNDSEIALHGFKTDELLDRKPDLIWMPHEEYTYQRGLMYSDPRLLREYDVYPHVAAYGIAVRKQSPNRAATEKALQHFWSINYPDTVMADHEATAITWAGTKRLVAD